MIAELFKTLFEFLKLAPRYLIALGVGAAFLLFGDELLLKKLGVVDFTQSNRSILGLVLIGSISLFGVSLSADIIGAFRRWQRQRKFYNRVKDRLQRLTENEKQILRFYVAENTRANVLRIDDGVVQGLVADGIIHRSASLGSMLEGWAHNINDFAWDYIHVYPHVLEGSTNTYRTDKRRGMW